MEQKNNLLSAIKKLTNNNRVKYGIIATHVEQVWIIFFITVILGADP